MHPAPDTRSAVLAGKTGVVTGAARGVGLAVCRELAGRGVRVFGLDINAPADDGAGDENGDIEHLIVDVCDEDSLTSVIRNIEATGGPPDIVVNNARAEVVAPVGDFPLEGWDSTISVLLRAHLLMARAVLPGMVTRRGGSIVSISSPHAHLAHPGHAAYGVAKAGADRLTKQIAYEYAPYGIRANLVTPGSVMTELKRQILAADPVQHARLSSLHPLGRLVDPEDIARVVAALVSDDFAMVTGQNIFVDGGTTLALPSLDLARRVDEASSIA